MDEETVKKVKNLIYEAAEKHGINLRDAIIFGSRARENYREKSDIDLILTSPDFRGVAWNKRPGPFYEEWNYDELPDPEFICLTPEEFERKKKEKPNIVRTAVKEGASIE